MRIIDFGAGAPPWRNIDDVVMGGRSSSGMEVDNGVAVFSGEVSLANNGGFASVRSSPGNYDLSGFDGLSLRLRGDGKRYAVRVRTSDALADIGYQVKVEPPAEHWQELFLPFAEFSAVFRGRPVSGHPPLDPALVRSFGLLIADGQEGPFRLEVAWVAGSSRP